MAPKIFGIEHIIYMVISFGLMIAGLIVIKKFCKTEKSKTLTIKISGLVLLLVILLNRYACTLCWENEPFLPSSICGLASLVFAIMIIVCKKDSTALHFIIYTALLGGLISTVYPTYIGQGPTIFYFPTITSLLHHTIDIFCAILLFETGYVSPNIKKWYAWPLGYCTFVVYGLFMIKYMGKADAMSINSPLISGTILNWFYMGLIFLALYTVFLIIFDLIKNKKNCIWCEWYGKIKSIIPKKVKVESSNAVEQTDKKDNSNNDTLNIEK